MFSQEHFVSIGEKEADYSLEVNIYMKLNPSVPHNHTTQTRYILNKAALEGEIKCDGTNVIVHKKLSSVVSIEQHAHQNLKLWSPFPE